MGFNASPCFPNMQKNQINKKPRFIQNRGLLFLAKKNYSLSK